MVAATTILKEKRMPDEPGVYLMKDSDGKIIYIGKAKNLRKRVTSYFTKHDPDVGWKTSRLVNKIADIEFIVTDNEIEAFLLESNLIKRYRPVFNIELKDQQRYTYLKITDEPFPRLLVARRNRNGEFLGPKGKVYGPFVRGSSKFLTVGLLRKLFKIRICNRLPKTPCLQYFIKNCEAPCIANVTRGHYMMNVMALQDILEGKSSIDKFANNMEDEMKRASDLGDYERAKEIRDTLYRLNNLRVKQKMEKAVNRNPDEEYISIMRDNKKGIAHVMALRRTRGVISDRKKFEFDLVGDNSLSSFLVQYYSSVPVIPRFLYVNEDLDDRQVLERSLEKIAGHRVSIFNIRHVLAKEKRQLMDLISRNLSMYIERGYDPAVVELKNAIRLLSMPEVIDCFDVSNLGTSIAVGSCVRFANNKPAKSSYKKFRIRTVAGQNDFAMIGELVRRRYHSAGDDEKLPDLIVIDGGHGQLGAAVASLRSLGIHDVPCIGLAKENEEIYMPGLQEPIVLPKSNAGLKMLQHARDEAHRFGLAYNVNLRKLRH
ncbi:excinuclease ABC, C subunit [Candidatus Nitrososphaera gargensis Ga9.2]|uniref:Excinuclease ABC, C subunit n=2 Tax=Candidatus Nitrososphaera gargensis TaxID=497727 RepID=K0IA66_NITGG